MLEAYVRLTNKMMGEPQSWRKKELLIGRSGTPCTWKHTFFSHSFLTKNDFHQQIPALERDKKRWAERKREEKSKEEGEGGYCTLS